MADVEKLTVTVEANIAQYNADLAKAAQQTQQQTTAMENDFAALSASVQAAQAKVARGFASASAPSKIAGGLSAAGAAAAAAAPNFDKVSTGMSGIGKAALEAQVATELGIDGLNAFGKSADGVSHAIGGLSTQGMAAFHSLRGGAEMLAQGAPLLRVMAMEMNNLTYAASGTGGLTGAMSEAAGIFSKLLNPVVLITGAFAGAGLAAAAAAVSYADAQSRIALALTGVGAAGGVTVDTINKISEATAAAGGVSVSEARDFATAIAQTGQTSVAVTGQATALAKSFSLVFGEDLQKSAKDLGAALADPAKGVDTINAKLLAFDQTTANYIKRLAAQGNLEEAQKTILAGIAVATATAAEKTTGWARAWDTLANSISNYINATGKLALPSSFQGPEDQLAAAQDHLTQLQNGRTLRGGTIQDTGQIAATQKLIADLKDQIEATGDAGVEAGRNLQSLKFGDLIDGADPATASLKALEDQLTAIGNNKTIPLGDQRAQLARANDQITSSITFLKQLQALGGGNIDVGETIKQTQDDVASINARTVAQKAAAAFQQTYDQSMLAHKGVVVSTADATAAANKSAAQSEHDLAEAQRDRIYQSQQAVDQGAVENSTIGLSVDAATRLTQTFQLLAAARQEAFKNGNVDGDGNPIVSATEQLNALVKADELGRQALENAQKSTVAGANFDISQFGRGDSEQNVYAALQSKGLLNNGEIVSDQAKQTAEVLRTKEAFGQLADAEKSFGTTFLNDLLQGKSATAALSDALSNLATKLADLGLDDLLGVANKGLMGALGIGGGDVGLGSWAATATSAFADGGIFVPGMGRQPLKRFAGGGISNQAAIFGEDGPEAAIPLKGGKVPVDLRMPIAAPSQQSSGPINISIDARNSTPAAVDKLNSQTLPQLEKLIDQRLNRQLTRSAATRKIIRGT